MFMKIKNVKHAKDGISVEFFTNFSVKPEDMFKIHYNGNEYYFEAEEIETSFEGNEVSGLKVIAKEIGFIMYRLEYLFAEGRDLYLGQLINIELEKVTDEEDIKRVREEDIWYEKR